MTTLEIFAIVIVIIVVIGWFYGMWRFLWMTPAEHEEIKRLARLEQRNSRVDK